MSELATPLAKKRPEFRNINAFTDLRTYRLPAAGIVSILHRVSGALMFLLMPFIIWMFDKSISSEISFEKFKALFNIGTTFDVTLSWFRSAALFSIPFPGWMVKLVALALIWAYLHHSIAGLRHLWSDTHHSAVTKEFGRMSAVVTLALSVFLTVVLGAKLFGVY
jgi:succinate dehydrogenase / fumarate reductase, cytochrome b subunit